MKLTFFQGPNFGDALNEYLLPKVFPEFFDDDETTLFIGIGSILYDSYPAKATKVVFGTGYGFALSAPIIDETWKIYGVRGPKTAEALKIDPRLVAADSAILIKKFSPPRTAPRHKFSFIPHWGSMKTGQWQKVTKDLGIHLIDPRWPVEQVLTDIGSSEVIVAEAMHGAIVADALRVPWIPLSPVEPVNRLKWFDWAGALDIKLNPKRLAASSVQEALIAAIGGPKARWVRGGIRVLGLEKFINIPFANAARSTLYEAMACEPTLSSDSAMDRAIDKLETAASEIKRSFPRVGRSIASTVT